MVVVKYVYDAWGNHWAYDGNGTQLSGSRYNIINPKRLCDINPFRYRGYFYDAETGLYYLKSRYYDPSIGRFISMDKVSYADPSTVDGLNLYAYCGNNPIKNVDSYGNSFSDFLSVTERIFTGIGLFCEYLAEHPGFVSWKQYHKAYPNVPYRNFIRQNELAIRETKSMGKSIGKVATAISLATLAIDIGSSWYSNYNSGNETWISDSVVDTIYKGARFGISYGITALCSALIPIPGLGTLIGVGISIGVDYFIQWVFEDLGILDNIKVWAADVGTTISNWWNSFWSFSWI